MTIILAAACAKEKVLIAEESGFQIVVRTDDDEQGQVAASHQRAEAGTVITVSATPIEGYVFNRWTVVDGDAILHPTANPARFTMPAGGVEVAAAFVVKPEPEPEPKPKPEPPQEPEPPTEYAIVVSGDAGGSVVADRETAPEGGEVRVFAVAAAEFRFTGWTATGVEIPEPTANPLTFAMPAGDVEIKAGFVPGEGFEVSLAPPENGTALADPEKADPGEIVTLTATPAQGFTFSKWVVAKGEAIMNTAANPTKFTMPAGEVEIKAVFVEAIDIYKVSVESGARGVAQADVAVARAGDEVTLTATPFAGFVFSRWTGLTLVDPTANPARFTMPAADVEITAEFVEAPEEPAAKYAVSVAGGANGTAEADPTQAEAGDEVTLTATPASGYTFEKWVVTSGGAILNAALNPTRFTMPAREVSVRAEFAPVKVEHAIALTTDGNGSAVADRENARQGERITVTAEPSEGYIFGRWTVLSGGVTLPNGNPAQFTMPDGAVEIRAEFAVKPPDENSITVATDGNGQASASASISKAGVPITLSATPEPGYRFARWVVTKGADAVFLNDETDPAARFIMPAATVGLRAEFTKTVYDIILSDDGHGSATSDKPGATMQERVSLGNSPDPGYEFLRWVLVSGDVTDLSGDAFTMPIGAVEIRAEFRLKTLQIRATTDGKGSANTDKPTAKMGETVQLSAEPREGYLFLGWKVVGGGVTPANTATASFVLGPDDVEAMAMFVHIPREPFILHLDSNGRLAAGQWNDTAKQDNLLFFKLGGLVGVTVPASTPNGTEWVAGLARTEFYNPTAIRLDGLYNGVPGYNDDPVTDITKPEYNTDAMARAGKGDPCRLIGLTAEEAQAMAENGTLTAYDSGFRTPTTAEMADYSSGSTTWTTIGGMTGRWRNSAPDASTFLPAAGMRVPSGRVDEVGTEGTYWAANGINRTLAGGKCLYFTATSGVVTETLWSYGFTARCVRK